MLLLFIFHRTYNYLNEILPSGNGFTIVVLSANLYVAVRVIVGDELMIIVRKQVDPSDGATTNLSVHNLEYLIPNSPMHIHRKKLYSVSGHQP